MKKIEHMPVNWVNGLKLTSNHFFEQHQCYLEALRQTTERHITQFNFGLGDKIESMESSLALEVSGESISSLSVKLICCNAITKSGIPVIYYDGLYGDMVPSANISAGNSNGLEDVFYVLVSANASNLIPVGEPDPEESPLRHPYVLPAIHLHIVPRDQLNKSFTADRFIPVGMIKRTGGSFSLDSQYIPPVQRCGVHDGISSFITHVAKSLRGIKEDIRTIYSKNLMDRRREELANNTLLLCEGFSSFFDSSIFWIETMSCEDTPVALIRVINTLANTLNSKLEILPEASRERLLQYYHDWTNTTPSEFLNSIEKMVSIRYDHIDIASSLEVAGSFISLLRTMFRKMSELEYIGMIRENIVVGDDNLSVNDAPKKRKWSFIK